MLSVVIPAFNAAAHIGACLDALVGADVVVVDGGSTDGTVEAAKGARVISSARGRGVQLAAGAKETRGEWLLFLHADTRLSPAWREVVDAHTASHSGPACFRFKLNASEWQARVVEAGVAARVRVLGLPYGDQGLLVSRAQYETVGGYRPLPLMEDVDLVRRLGRIAVLEADAVTSPERWRRDGWVRRSARNLSILALHRLGLGAERLERLYG